MLVTLIAGSVSITSYPMVKFLSEISVTEIFQVAPSLYVRVTRAPTYPTQQEGSKVTDLKMLGARSASASALTFVQKVFMGSGITLDSVWVQLVGMCDLYIVLITNYA